MLILGELLAIMGPSGSGKTSLLNIISGRVREGVTGDIYYNNRLGTKGLKRRIGYVMQSDVFFENLTTEQHLTYMAQLRLPQELKLAEKQEMVTQTAELLGLGRSLPTPLYRLSGGERRRVNVATELVADPSVLFLDEPTSGLDSSTAFRLTKSLREVSSEGRTIIATIHQPSSQIYRMFDNLLLLADGHTVYFGPAANMVTYFESLGYPFMPLYNPADFMSLFHVVFYAHRIESLILSCSGNGFGRIAGQSKAH